MMQAPGQGWRSYCPAFQTCSPGQMKTLASMFPKLRGFRARYYQVRIDILGNVYYAFKILQVTVDVHAQLTCPCIARD